MNASVSSFASRHLGPAPDEIAEMLAAVGVESLEALVDAAVPPVIRQHEPVDLPPPLSEAGALAELRSIADQNRPMTSLIGLGYHGTHTPPVIRRNVLEDPAWYTAYTPYQPEISQGRLEALLDFQTMVTDLTGTELANASLLDEGTAAAEAMTLLHRIGRGGAPDRFLVDADCHPHTIAAVRTRAEPLGFEVVVADAHDPDTDFGELFGVLGQHPGSSGRLVDPAPVIGAAHDAGALVAVATDLLACCLLTPPGELGADVVVGSSQRFGVPMFYGGPHAAFLATREEHRRSLPGRLVGVSKDAAGRPALRLALQTREQHIRRERATSNICTAQVLLAVVAALYACYHGPRGLVDIAERVHQHTRRLAGGLRAAGIDVVNDTYFDTLTVRVPDRAAEVLAAAVERGINLRPVDGDRVGVSLDETTTDGVVDEVLAAFEAEGAADDDGLPTVLRRTSSFLSHPVFHEHRTETEMLRHLRRLADRDVALDRSMIPLGSCTMKLNATAEMEPISWPGFADLHPFAPADQARGYRERLLPDLERWLAELTGYDAVSLQPNAGSQGELAGLLAIRRYHRARGDEGRQVCLIPSSAHGTNAASAVMAGMDVVVVACDERGNVDLGDLKSKLSEHADTIAALMVTYPSTHGVFEDDIVDVCDAVHTAGGQVYLDGANLNALVGVARPGDFGADVSHLNLHKTFCIPHGGGGPGMGPIGVREHLAPYLPTHPLVPESGPPTGPSAVSAAPWGSAGILPISWAYVAMMGAEGLTAATQVAILSANYVARRLTPHFPVLYTGRDGLVAHECIIDLRPLTKTTEITVEDVAKRLIDYGFHAPTMSFPVAGTFMIEPTESESKAELDRFCEAMAAIRAEIADVESGRVAAADSPLRHAPHTAADVVTDAWNHPYGREQAAFPVDALRVDKYWPPVSRIDQGWGDRNLMCSCPSLADLADAGLARDATGTDP